MDERITPTEEQLQEVSDVAFRDPFGADPEVIPDPMPAELQSDETISEVADKFEGMEGDAPSS